MDHLVHRAVALGEEFVAEAEGDVINDLRFLEGEQFGVVAVGREKTLFSHGSYESYRSYSRPALDPVANDLQNRFPLLAFQRQARGAHPFCSQTAFLDCQFDILHKFYGNIQVEQRGVPAVEFSRFFPFPAGGKFP